MGSIAGPASGLDADTAITSTAEAACIAMRTANRFLGRYISNRPFEQAGDLTTEEMIRITSGGLAVVVIQHALAPGTLLTAALGRQIGVNAVTNASSIGVPTGAAIWLDLEGFGPGSDALGFAESWSDALRTDGRYVPALYYGTPGLSPGQVDALLAGGIFESAWAGCAQATGIGEAVDQGPCEQLLTVVCGGVSFGPISVDVDTVRSDSTLARVVTGDGRQPCPLPEPDRGIAS